jgi:hypothetical protein
LYIISGQLNTFDWPIYVWSKQSPSHVPLGFVSSHLNSFWIGQTLGQLHSHSCFADWKIGDIKNKTLIILQNKYYSVQAFYYFGLRSFDFIKKEDSVWNIYWNKKDPEYITIDRGNFRMYCREAETSSPFSFGAWLQVFKLSFWQLNFNKNNFNL